MFASAVAVRAFPYKHTFTLRTEIGTVLGNRPRAVRRASHIYDDWVPLLTVQSTGIPPFKRW